MDNPQPPLEERRVAQQACKGDERRLRAHFYEMPMYDQETETEREAQLNAAPSLRPPTPEPGSPACRSG